MTTCARLGQLRDLAGAREVGLLLPGHGPMLTDPLGTLDYYLSHREERLDQVRSALAAGAKTPAEIVAMIYTDVDPSVWPAAEWSVRAQLDYLADAEKDHGKQTGYSHRIWGMERAADPGRSGR